MTETLKRATVTDALTENERRGSIVFSIRCVYVCVYCVSEAEATEDQSDRNLLGEGGV